VATELRTIIARLTTFRCTWTLAEVVTLSDVQVSGIRRYLSALVNQRVLINQGEHYAPGPKARAWRENQPKRKGPSTYGNNAKYRAEKEVWDAIRLREWQARRSEPTPILTSTEVQTPTTSVTETHQMQAVSHQPPLTMDEAATLLNVSIGTVRNEIKRGKISAFRIGSRGVRIAVEALDAYRTANAITQGKQA
jgi:excisionase family DNA binding protein